VAGDTIKVAKGTYKPTTDINNRDASFSVKNYMVVLGGYPDTGNPTDIDAIGDSTLQYSVAR
jgi:hypothetical protein